MEFQDVVRRRRMTRNFAPDPLDPKVVTQVLDNATRAPSAGFAQGWAFLVLDTPVDVARFWAATTDGGEPDAWLAGVSRAPVLILPCSSKAAYLSRYAERDKGWTDRDETRWPMPFWHMDAAMGALLMMQTATDEGLGSLFFGIQPEREAAVRSEFAIPEAFDPIGVVALGRPATGGAKGSPSRRRRTPLADLVHRGGW